ncbi:MAG: GRP family sugar transporter [Patescibacteria group bacterium]
MLGYLLAFVSSIFFGLYVVPRKLSKLEPVHFSLLMSFGFFVGSVLLYLLQPLLQFQETINSALLWSLLAGAIWATSFLLLVYSIDRIGLSRSNQWKNLQGPVGVVLSLVILAEYSTTNAFFAVLAGIAIFVSALFFSATTPEKGKANSYGILLAILAGLGFGIVAVINKYVTDNVGVYSQQVVWSFAMVLTLLFYAFFKSNLPTLRTGITRRESMLGILAGLLYLGASFFMLQSFKYIDASVGFTIVQLNALWTIAVGIFIFKEVDLKLHSKKVWWGILFAIIGVVLLLFTRK